jgi:hypothetical protein
MNNNINFKELRLDNYICINNNLHPCRVKEITMSSVVVESIKENYSEPTINSMNPIPLTEEWLIKFGFEKKIDCYKNINYNFNGYFASFDCDNPMWFGEDGCCEQVTIKDNIKYVHQLQNLYFAVTGEELTMK